MTKEERNKLIEDNLNLVYHVAHKYFDYELCDKEDFISEGYIGLIKAANKYDKAKQIRFSTFACKCIYYHLCSYLFVQNHYCRKANNDAVSLETKTFDDNEKTTLKDLIISEEDYSVANANDILSLIDKLNIKDAKYIIIKKVEGYSYTEIGKFLGVSRHIIYHRLKSLRKKLIELDINIYKRSHI